MQAVTKYHYNDQITTNIYHGVFKNKRFWLGNSRGNEIETHAILYTKS
jgi:hypothetical protein